MGVGSGSNELTSVSPSVPKTSRCSLIVNLDIYRLWYILYGKEDVRSLLWDVSVVNEVNLPSAAKAQFSPELESLGERTSYRLTR